MNGPPIEDDVAQIQSQLDMARDMLAKQNGEIANLRSQNAEQEFDIKHLKAEIIKLQHALKSCQTELNGSKGASQS